MTDSTEMHRNDESVKMFWRVSMQVRSYDQIFHNSTIIESNNLLTMY